MPLGCSTGFRHSATHLALSALGSNMSKGVMKSGLERYTIYIVVKRRYCNFEAMKI